MSLQSAFEAYNRNELYPFHMPGHKRNVSRTGPCGNPYLQDYTEVEGLDNLYTASGILQESMEQAARLFGSPHCLYCVNGSTGGLLTAVFAVLRPGDTALVARNCHKSVYNGLALRQANVRFLMPDLDETTGIPGSIPPERVGDALEQDPNIRLVILTSPTYEGVLSDVASITALAHRKNIPVLVDEAHGAHLHFSQTFGIPGSAVDAGADLVVQSLHKTLPALTQTALLHGQGSLVPWERVRTFWSALQTSSPSYLLMESMDRCCGILEQHPEWFEEQAARISAFSQAMKELRHLSVLCKGMDSSEHHPSFFSFDPDKLVLCTHRTPLTGEALSRLLLREHGMQLEMASLHYALAMTSICDTPDALDRLAEALLYIDRSLEDAPGKPTSPSPLSLSLPLPDSVCCFSKGDNSLGTYTPLDSCTGRTALEFVYLYPPGIPVLVPGERISPQAVEYLQAAESAGLEIQTGRGRWDGTVRTSP